MKLYEKIITILLAIVFCILLFSNLIWLGYLQLAIWLLAFSYFIGGYWLFNSKEHKRKLLPITAGFVFAISIFAIPMYIQLRIEKIYAFFPIPNAMLCLGLVIYLFKNKNTQKNNIFIKNIFKRSLVILIVSSIFTYLPVTFKPYRQVLMALNSNNTYIYDNLLMFDYTAKFNNALKNGDCDKAIEYALNANEAGMSWLGIGKNVDKDTLSGLEAQESLNRLLQDSSIGLSAETREALKTFTLNIDTSVNHDLYKIAGTYISLYKAYKCKASAAYDQDQFKDALLNYQIAHEYLTSCEQTIYWEEEKSWSLNNIALCYRNRNNYTLADSLHIAAIENYRSLHKENDASLAKFYSDFGFTLLDEKQYPTSSKLFYTANSILLKDTTNVDNRNDLATNYNGLANSFLKQDSLTKALFFIQRAENFADKKSSKYCLTTLYHSIYYYKINKFLQANSVLKTCLSCYESQSGNYAQQIAECNRVLSMINIALANYDDAKKYINVGMKITQKNFGANSIQYAGFLSVLAEINKIMSDYSTSQNQYKQAISIYNHAASDKNYVFPNAIAGLSDLEIILSNFTSAKQFSDLALATGAHLGPLDYPLAFTLLNNAAYLNYCLGNYKASESFYNKVIKIDHQFNPNPSVEAAIALNGLGLIATANNNYKKADSLFLKSLEQHQNLFTDNNPLTAIVYLNYGILGIHQGKLSEAEARINKAFVINKHFFKSDHDVFGDIYVAFGDLAKKKGQNAMAQVDYQKALDIYKKKFDEQHWKVVATKRKLGK